MTWRINDFIVEMVNTFYEDIGIMFNMNDNDSSTELLN